MMTDGTFEYTPVQPQHSSIPMLPASREQARQLVETLSWPDAPRLAHIHEWGPDRFGPTRWREPRGRYVYAGRDGFPADCPPGASDETFRTCSYCGSIHPQDLARILLDAPREQPALPPDPMEALDQWVKRYMAEHDGQEPSGADCLREHERAYTAYYSAKRAQTRLDGADWKYGWPHKFYVEGIPNPAAGQPACVGSSSDSYIEHGEYHYRVIPHISPAPTTMQSKWYNTHFADLEGATFDFMAALIHEHTRIRFYRIPSEGDLTRLHYYASRRGYQA